MAHYPRPPAAAWTDNDSFDPSAGFAANAVSPQRDLYASQRYTPQPAPRQEHKAGSSRQRLTLLPAEDGGEIEEVIAEVTLDGLALMDPTTGEARRKLPLDEVPKWDLCESTALVVTHRPKGGKEKALPLTGQRQQVKALAESLSLHALQLSDMRGCDPKDLASLKVTGVVENPVAQQADDRDGREQGQNAGEAKEQRQEKSVPDVDFWSNPDYCGWLYKRGEHLSTWRRRWFVLKGAKMLWFKEADITSESKPRGTLTIRGQGAWESSAKPHALELGFEEAVKAGCGLLLSDSDRERDQWVQAIQLAAVKTSQAPVTSEAPASSSSSSPSNLQAHSQSSQGATAELQKGLEQLNMQARPTRQQPQASPAPTAPSFPDAQPRAPPLPQQPRQQQVRSPQQQQGSWRVAFADDGRPYYYDLFSGAVQWERPPGL